MMVWQIESPKPGASAAWSRRTDRTASAARRAGCRRRCRSRAPAGTRSTADARGRASAPRSIGHAASGPRGGRDAAPVGPRSGALPRLRHGLHRVERDVQQHLGDQIGVNVDRAGAAAPRPTSTRMPACSIGVRRQHAARARCTDASAPAVSSGTRGRAYWSRLVTMRSRRADLLEDDPRRSARDRRAARSVSAGPARWCRCRRADCGSRARRPAESWPRVAEALVTAELLLACVAPARDRARRAPPRAVARRAASAAAPAPRRRRSGARLPAPTAAERKASPTGSSPGTTVLSSSAAGRPIVRRAPLRHEPEHGGIGVGDAALRVHEQHAEIVMIHERPHQPRRRVGSARPETRSSSRWLPGPGPWLGRVLGKDETRTRKPAEPAGDERASERRRLLANQLAKDLLDHQVLHLVALVVSGGDASLRLLDLRPARHDPSRGRSSRHLRESAGASKCGWISGGGHAASSAAKPRDVVIVLISYAGPLS